MDTLHTKESRGSTPATKARLGVSLLLALVMASTALVGGLASSASALTPISNPAKVTATAGDKQVTVSWPVPVPSDNIRGYRVDITSTGAAVPSVYVSGVNTLTTDVTGLTNGVKYTFAVTSLETIDGAPAVGSAPTATTTPKATTTTTPPPVVTGPYVFPTVAALIQQHYHEFLGRAPSFSELVYWTAYIQANPGNPSCAGAATAATKPPCAPSGEIQLINLLRTASLSAGNGAVAAPDYTEITPSLAAYLNPLTRLYYAYFRRVPDLGGLRYWASQLAAGKSLDVVSDWFAHSPEFMATYGSLNDSDFVTLVYFNVLGRAPDFGGQNFWVSQLAAGQTRGWVMTRFSDSAEYRGEAYVLTEPVNVYVGLLNRVPTANEALQLADQLRAGNMTVMDLIMQVRNSAEYRALVSA